MRIWTLKLSLAVILSALSFFANAQKIGLLLGSFVSERWYLDQKLFTDRIKELGAECLVEVAYDSDDQLKLAKELIQKGVEVLVIVAMDAVQAANIVDVAKASNIPVIAYDRLILSNDIAIYISYDNEKVGNLQAEYMLRNFPEGNYFLINGPVSDYNAVLFRKGQLDVLKEHIEKGKIKILEDYVMDSWSEIGAFEKTKEYFSANNPAPDVVLAANDALANGVIQGLPADVMGKIAISGQDADLAGIKNIIAGTQTMTIYKAIKPLAYKAAELALDLQSGKKVRGSSKMQINNVTVEAILLNPVVIDKSNYKETIIRDGHVSLSEVVRNLGESFEQERRRIQLSLLQKENALEVAQKVNQRNIFIAITAFLFLSIIGFSFTIYQKQKDNKLLNTHKMLIEQTNRELFHTNQKLQSVNEELQSLNEELLQKQEEISSQRDAIARQNEKLQEAYNIIATQKDEITRQNETLENEVEKRTAELVQYNQQLEQYAFITAHNLRAPVARVIGLGQLIQLQQSDPAETKFIIDQLVSSSQELDRVIKELNTILDMRNTSMNVFTEVDLIEEMNSIVNNLKTEIEQTNALIRTDFTNIPKIFSIKPYTHSILLNLVSNAIKYRHPERQPVIFVKTESIDRKVCLSVSDNGIGIDLKAHQNTMFQLYKRFHFHTEGRGIGLFLVKSQVDLLGGKIQIESEVDKGTNFKIFLPYALDA